MALWWCSNDSLLTKGKANVSKYHLLVIKKAEVIIRRGDTEIRNREYKKWLGMKVDTKQTNLMNV